MAKEEKSGVRIEIFTDALKEIPTAVYEDVLEYDVEDSGALSLREADGTVRLWPFTSFAHVAVKGDEREDE